MILKVNHKQQVNDGYNWKCGIVSLDMVFDYYNIPFDSDEAWECVRSLRPRSTDQYYALSSNLAKYSIEKGLIATIYKGTQETCLKVLEMLSNKGTPAILSLMQKKSKQSHFVVFSGYDHGTYCFCDPDEKKIINRFTETDVCDLWKPNLEIGVTGYILIVFSQLKEDTINCLYCNRNIPIVHSELKDITQGCICPYCDRLLSFRPFYSLFNRHRRSDCLSGLRETPKV